MERKTNTAPTDAEYEAAMLVVARRWADNTIEALDECVKDDPALVVDEEAIRAYVTPFSNDSEIDPDDWSQMDLGAYQLVCAHYGVTPTLKHLPFQL